MSALTKFAALAGGGAVDTDPYFSNVSLLLHMDGSNGGTTFTDSSPSTKAVTVAGNANTSTAQSKFGGASAYFDETGDYLNTTIDQLGTGDFTIECWVRTTTNPVGNGQGVFQLSNGTLNTTTRGPAVGFENASGKWTLYYGTTVVLHASLIPSINTWYHVAYVRVGGQVSLYVDGVLIFGPISDSTNYTDTNFTIGGWYTTGYLLNGYIDDLRITKGIARYTANFTPPTKAFPDTGNAPYATWNPSDKGSAVTLSGGNLSTSINSTSNNGVRATTGKASGKWYYEVTAPTNGNMPGIATLAASVTTTGVGWNAGSWGWFGSTGVVYQDSTNRGNAGTYTNTDNLGIGIDLDNSKVYFYKNNVLGNVFSIAADTWYPAIGTGASGTNTATANFGQNPLKYTPPNGTFWNPKDTGSTNTFSNNNLTCNLDSSLITCRANTSKSTGKLYFEVRCISVGNICIGIANSSATLSNYLGYDANGYSYHTGGNKWNNNTGTAYGNTFSSGDVIGVAVNLTDGKIYFSKNGTWQNSGTPGGGETGYAFSGISGTFFPAVGSKANVQINTVNFGATPFAYSPPTGYSAWDDTVYNAGVF